MGTLGTLAVSILGDSKDLDKAFDDVKKKTSDLGKSIQDTGKKVGNVGKGMTKWVTGPIAAVGGGLFALAQKTANAGDEIQKMALRTGFSTEALSEYKHAAELSGTSLESMENGVKRMQRSIFDLERGLATQTEAFEAMGLAIEDVQGLSPEEQFNKVTMALADVEDESRRAALAQQVFGRAGTELLPMLASGADGIEAMRQEARDLGIVFDQEAADAAAQFNDDMDRLKKGFAGVFQELGQQLIPLMTEKLIPAIKENIIPLVKQFGERIGKLLEWFANLDPKLRGIILGAVGLAAALGPVLMVLGPIITAIGALVSPIGLVVVAIAGLTAAFVYLWNTNEKFRDTVTAIWEGIKKTAIAIFEGLKKFWENWGETILAVAKRIWDQIKLVIETVINLIKDIIGLVIAVIQGDWEEAWERIKSIGETIWNFIKGTVENVFGAIRDIISGIWDNIKDRTQQTWNTIRSWVTNTVNGIRDGMVRAFERVRDRIKSIWDSIYNSIRSIVNRIIDTLNRFIRGANRLSFDIPSWVPGLGGRSFGLNIPEIPRLHTGTQYFRPPGGGEEGLAILKRGEKVIPQGQIDTGGTTFNFERMFEGANISIRSDEDIRKFAKEIYDMFKTTSRGQGVLT